MIKYLKGNETFLKCSLWTIHEKSLKKRVHCEKLYCPHVNVHIRHIGMREIEPSNSQKLSLKT